MRHRLYFFLSFGFVGAAQAQTSPSITRADLPVAGDTLRLSQAAPLLDALPPLSQKGANQTWNYTGLLPVGQRVERYADLNTLPLTQQFTFGAFGGVNRANLVSPQTLPLPAGTTLPIAVSDPIALFNLSNTEFRSVGFGATVSSFALPVTYPSAGQQDVIYHLPISYASDADSSNSYFEVNLAGTAFLSQKRKRVNKPDAWGTLTTPYGTFQTVRVVTKLLDHDSVSTGGTPGTGLTLPLRYEYKWLAKEVHVPVLTIMTAVLNEQEVVISIEYRDIYRRILRATATRNASFDATLAAYPSPLPTSASLQLRGLAGHGPVTISATDVTGRLLFRRMANGAQDALTVSAGELGNFHGMLLLTLLTEQGVAVRRVLRE